jgi:hypothetical protein
MAVVPTGDGSAEPDRKRLDVNSPPPGRQIMAQFVKEDENAEHDDEGGHGACEIRKNMRHWMRLLSR